jgi:hypothetical protein
MKKRPRKLSRETAEQMLGRLLPDRTRNLEIAEASRAVATPHSDTRAFRRVTD